MSRNLITGGMFGFKFGSSDCISCLCMARACASSWATFATCCFDMIHSLGKSAWHVVQVIERRSTTKALHLGQRLGWRVESIDLLGGQPAGLALHHLNEAFFLREAEHFLDLLRDRR